jgi:hypothetical protein
MTLRIDIQHNSIECHCAESHYAKCFNYLNVRLSVVMLSVIRLNIVMLSVTAPCKKFANYNPDSFHNIKFTFTKNMVPQMNNRVIFQNIALISNVAKCLQTQHNDTQHNNTQDNAIQLNGAVLSAIMLNVIMLSVTSTKMLS